MQLNNNLKILHWNAQGITNQSKFTQLEYLLESLNIDIALLNETFLNPTNKLSFNNYNILRNDRQSHGGGVAIFVQKSISYKELPHQKTKNLENISIEIIVNNRSIIITSAYNPRYTPDFLTDIKKVTPCQKEFITFGDLNAKHFLWNCPRSNTAGSTLNNYHQHANFFIHHTPRPTYYPHQQNRSPSTLDLLLTNTSLHIKLWMVNYSPIMYQ